MYVILVYYSIQLWIACIRFAWHNTWDVMNSTYIWKWNFPYLKAILFPYTKQLKNFRSKHSVESSNAFELFNFHSIHLKYLHRKTHNVLYWRPVHYALVINLNWIAGNRDKSWENCKHRSISSHTIVWVWFDVFGRLSEPGSPY